MKTDRWRGERIKYRLALLAALCCAWMLAGCSGKTTGSVVGKAKPPNTGINTEEAPERYKGTNTVSPADIVFYDRNDRWAVSTDADGNCIPGMFPLEIRRYPADADCKTLTVSVSNTEMVQLTDLKGTAADRYSLDMDGSLMLTVRVLNPGEITISAEMSDGSAMTEYKISVEKVVGESGVTKADADINFFGEGTILDCKGELAESPDISKVPTIHIQPSDEFLEAGRKLTIQCVSDTDNDYEWFFIDAATGTVLPVDEAEVFFHAAILDDIKSEITIEETPEQMDNWRVQCKISNGQYSVYSRAATINVLRLVKPEDTKDNDEGKPEPLPPDTKQAAIHVHHYRREYISPTYSAYGYWKYSCICGESYGEYNPNDPPLVREKNDKVHEHIFTTKETVPPQNGQVGYTRHHCDCGYYFDDDFRVSENVDISIEEAEQYGNSDIQSCGQGITRKPRFCYSPMQINREDILNNGGQTYLNQLVRNAVNTTFAKILSASELEDYDYCCQVTVSESGSYVIAVYFSEKTTEEKEVF